MLEKNPNYWQPGIPYLDGATFKVLQDSNARVLQLQGGDLDIATLVPYNQLDILRSDPAFIVYPETVARIDITSINTKRPPFDDKKLRQAMNYAVNKEAIIQNVLFGVGEMATSFLPKMPGRDPFARVPIRPREGQGPGRRVGRKGRLRGRLQRHRRGRCQDSSRPARRGGPGPDWRQDQRRPDRRQYASGDPLHDLRFRSHWRLLHHRHHRPGRTRFVRCARARAVRA